MFVLSLLVMVYVSSDDMIQPFTRKYGKSNKGVYACAATNSTKWLPTELKQ